MYYPEFMIFSKWSIIAMILSIIGGVLIYIFFLKQKNDKLSPLLKLLKNFLDFNKMIIEDILKIIYLISTIFIILISFNFIAHNFGMFFLFLILGPIFIRLIYELILIIINIWKNTNEIKEKMK